MKAFYILILCFLSPYVMGQDNLELGVLPKLSVSTRISNTLKFLGSVESRQLMYQEEQARYNYVLTDFIGFISYSLHPDQKLNFGYTLRVQNGLIFHRLSEHFNLLRLHYNFRLGHRFALDQTFANQRATVYRGRYRITIEKPLSGDKVDPKEFYIKMGNEYLYGIRNGSNSFEIRLIPKLGYEINLRNKLEAGIDYRLKDAFADNSESNFWLRLTWYTTLEKSKTGT